MDSRWVLIWAHFLEVSSWTGYPHVPAWFGFWPDVPERIKFEKVLIVTWATSFVGRNHGIFRSWFFRFFLGENRVHKITHIRILISKPLFHLLMFLFHSLWRRYRPISPLLTCGCVAWHWVPPAVVEAYSYQLATNISHLEKKENHLQKYLGIGHVSFQEGTWMITFVYTFLFVIYLTLVFCCKPKLHNSVLFQHKGFNHMCQHLSPPVTRLWSRAGTKWTVVTPLRYCMPYPYDVLSAAAYPAVTNARASGWPRVVFDKISSPSGPTGVGLF